MNTNKIIIEAVKGKDGFDQLCILDNNMKEVTMSSISRKMYKKFKKGNHAKKMEIVNMIFQDTFLII